MAMITEVDLLRRVPLFRDLTEEQLSSLAAGAVKQRVRRGDKIVAQGQRSAGLFILLTGRARVILSDERAREVVLASLDAGDCFGEMSLIDGEVHSADVRAEGPCDLLLISQEAFLGNLPPEGSMAKTLLVSLVRRLRAADSQIESLALLDVWGRVARALLAKAELQEGQRIIRQKVSRQDLAKVVGASREMVSRVMKDLEERGLIRTMEDGQVHLLGKME